MKWETSTSATTAEPPLSPATVRRTLSRKHQVSASASVRKASVKALGSSRCHFPRLAHARADSTTEYSLRPPTEMERDCCGAPERGAGGHPRSFVSSKHKTYVHLAVVRLASQLMSYDLRARCVPGKKARRRSGSRSRKQTVKHACCGSIRVRGKHCASSGMQCSGLRAR